eukprot:TRINITY_DN34501_c0_g1_i1.p1 TRINITY_DN34501_c0_g1~~TRINITY_DN34501_c0_g1_i1.p1  ORF type:complete len:232 (+),score=5.76 TRINITY_DN34501_c0_g1_i1:1-696(+)
MWCTRLILLNLLAFRDTHGDYAVADPNSMLHDHKQNKIVYYPGNATAPRRTVSHWHGSNRSHTANPTGNVHASRTEENRWLGKSKTILVLIETFGLGLLGLDRLYMGCYQTFFLKLLTGGGVCIWTVLDLFLVLRNALARENSIDSLGMSGTFAPESIDTAYGFAVVDAIVIALSLCCSCCVRCCIRVNWEAEKDIQMRELPSWDDDSENSDANSVEEESHWLLPGIGILR